MFDFEEDADLVREFERADAQAHAARHAPRPAREAQGRTAEADERRKLKEREKRQQASSARRATEAELLTRREAWERERAERKEAQIVAGEKRVLAVREESAIGIGDEHILARLVPTNRRERENEHRLMLAKLHPEECERLQALGWPSDWREQARAALRARREEYAEGWRERASTFRKGLRVLADVAAQGRGWPKDWPRKSLCRLFGDVEPRRFAVIDGEWIPPSEFADKGGDRKYSSPIEQRLFTVFDGFHPADVDETDEELVPNLDVTLEKERAVTKFGYRHYRSMAELLDGEIRPDTAGTWYFAHSGGKSDYLFLFEELIRRFNASEGKGIWQAKSDQAGSRMQFVTVRYGHMVPRKSKGVHSDGIYSLVSRKKAHPDAPVPPADGEFIYVKRTQKGRTGKVTTYIEKRAPVRVRLRADEHGEPLPDSDQELEFKALYTWQFVDSFALFPTALADIGKSVKLPKAFEDERMTREERRNWYANVEIKKLAAYNRRDCRSLYAGIDAYEDVVLRLGGRLKRTGASAALTLIKRGFLRRDILTDEYTNRIMTETYVASRVEMIRHELTNGLAHDINSSFAFSQLRALPGRQKDGPTDHIPKDPGACYAACVTIRVPEMFIPPLPMRMGDGSIYFPHGKWRAWLTTPDVELLLEAGGTIEKVHHVIHFEPFHELADYCREIWEMRLQAQREGDVASDAVYKRLLTAAYGKYAEKTMKQSIVISPSADYLAQNIDGDERHGVPGMQHIAADVWAKWEYKRPAHRHVVLSSFITADARANLTRHMWTAEKNGGCWYVDTDGIESQHNFPTDKSKLGALKLEAIVDYASFRGAKLYYLKGKEGGKHAAACPSPSTCRGCKPIEKIRVKGFRQLESREEFETLVSGLSIPRQPPEGVTAKEWERQRRATMLPQQRMVTLREKTNIARLLAEAEDLSAEDLIERGILSPTEVSFLKGVRAPLVPKRQEQAGGVTAPWDIEELRARKLADAAKGGDDEEDYG